MVKTVISDLGRVLIFFDNSIFLKKMANFCSLTEEEIREVAFKKLKLISAFDRGELTPKEFYEEVITTLETTINFDDFYSIYNDVFWLNPPTLELMKRLRERYKLVMLSNTDVMRFGFIREKFPEVMIFDEYVLSFEVGSMKPQPHIFRVALERAKSKAEECVFIDDRRENIEGAEKLGIKGILYEPQMDLEALLKKAGLSF